MLPQTDSTKMKINKTCLIHFIVFNVTLLFITNNNDLSFSLGAWTMQLSRRNCEILNWFIFTSQSAVQYNLKGCSSTLKPFRDLSCLKMYC